MSSQCGSVTTFLFVALLLLAAPHETEGSFLGDAFKNTFLQKVAARAGRGVSGAKKVNGVPTDNAQTGRRTLSEELNSPPLMAMVPAATSSTSDTAHSSLMPTTYSAVAKALPSNIKLVTLTNNYASHTDGAYLLRLSHLYAAGEHPTLAQPVTVDLSDVFRKAGLRITAATETTLTANQPLADFEARKHTWRAHAPNQAVAEHFVQVKGRAFERRVPFDFPNVTIRPMEVRTFLATFE